ncbi:MAG: CRISPR-associated helicase Cas3' [Petrotogales bacterium]
MNKIYEVFQSLIGKDSKPYDFQKRVAEHIEAEEFIIKEPMCKPYDFQKRVAEHIFKNEDVLLTAPTGCGKTEASLLPFLVSIVNNEPIADKLIYALPLRTLADSLYEKTKNQIEGFNKSLKVTIQTGSRKEDELFSKGDIIFTTIDQALSAYLNIPLPLPKRLATINAGIFVGGMLVVDEVHLLDDSRALATLAIMRKQLEGLCKFVIMSATVTDAMKKFLNTGTCESSLTLVSVGKEELKKMPPAERTRRIYTLEKLIDAETVIKKHQEKTIVVLNTVNDAQEIYKGIKEEKRKGEPKLKDCELILLHSRFLPDDRKASEDKLINLLGKEPGKEPNKDKNVILITTQVVEAGLDISSMDLFTACCPADSLVQRMGRCARFPGQEGNIWVAPPKKSNKPYDDKIVEKTWDAIHHFFLHYFFLHHKDKIVEKTWDVIKAFKQGQKIEPDDEEKLVKAVHEKDDKGKLTDALFKKKEEEVYQCRIDRDKGHASELIRYVESVSIAVTDEPEELLAGAVEGLISIHPGLLYKLFKAGQLRRWNYEVDENGCLKWEPIKNNEDGKKKFKTASIVAVPTEWASYCQKVGLQILNPEKDGPNVNGKPLAENGEEKKRELYSYKLETYDEHVRRCLEEYDSLADKHSVGFQALANKWNIPEKDLEALGNYLNTQEFYRAILRLAVESHDIGKRTDEWQKAIKDWQDEIDEIEKQDLMAKGKVEDFNPWRKRIKRNKDGSVDLAHSDFDPTKHKYSDQPKRPPHAAVSAYLAPDKIWKVVNYKQNNVIVSVGNVILLSILNHHGGFSLGGYHNDLHHNQQTIPYTDVNNLCKDTVGDIYVDNGEFLPMFWFAVRILRIADQNAMKEE